jgi:hypothetical protein
VRLRRIPRPAGPLSPYDLAKAQKRFRLSWISRARALFAPGDAQPCCVCGKYRSLTAAHHLIPLNMQFDLGFEEVNDDHVWLCPTHHAAVHRVIETWRLLDRRVLTKQERSRSILSMVLELADDELAKVIEVAQSSSVDLETERDA